MKAICSTVLNPGSTFPTWVDYHLKRFDRIFMYLDSSEETSPFIPSHPNLVVIEGSRAPQGSPISRILVRQNANLNDAISRCGKDGIDWLLHLDSDEIFHPDKPNWTDTDAGMIRFTNHEVIPVWEATNHFLECQYFALNGKAEFRAYGNGKCAARISADLQSHGPHAFKGHAGHVITSGAILHYTDATYAEWVKKYQNLGHFGNHWHDDPKDPIVLTFYLRSRDVFQRCVASGDHSEAERFFKSYVPSKAQLPKEIARGAVKRIKVPF